METQYKKIERALRQGRCTTHQLIRASGSTCPWKRCSEMEARGIQIRRGFVETKRGPVRCFWIDAGDCMQCGKDNPPGKAKQYCSDACRAKQHRKEIS